MPIRVSPVYSSLKSEDIQTPESLTNYFMRDIIRVNYEERHLQLGGFWFDISNPQIQGLEGELMLFSDISYSKNLALLLKLNQGTYLHPLAPNTLWRKLNEFSSTKQRERLLAGCKRMFEVADAFETRDYSMKLSSQDLSEPYKSIHCYTLDFLILRGKEIPLLHPNPRVQEKLKQIGRVATHGCGHTV